MHQTCATGLACLLLAWMATPAAAVNKCTGPDGAIVYQATPCQGSAASGKVNLSGAGQAQPDSQGARIARVETAIANREIAVGMTAAEAVRSWGRPDKINSTIGRHGRHEQWVYRRGNHTSQYVYVENGTVTSIQSQE